MTRHLDRALDLYADVILNPSFPDKELHRLKLGRLADLKAAPTMQSRSLKTCFRGCSITRTIPMRRLELGTLESVAVDHSRRCHCLLPHGLRPR